jgi:hypothetical protein
MEWDILLNGRKDTLGWKEGYPWMEGRIPLDGRKDTLG